MKTKMPPRPHGLSAHQHSIDRRSLLKAGLIAGASLAGCLGGPRGEIPDAVALSGALQCDACGMVIEKHPGPNGQVFYRDERPDGHDNPARFDSLKHCLLPYRLEHEQLDWTATAVYVTDYSSVDYTLQTEGDTTYVSSHTSPESFGIAEEMVYVVESDVQGAMGPDFVPFSKQNEAEAFATDNGGHIVEYDNIDEGLIGR